MKNQYAIQIKDLNFRYKKNEKYTLKNFNFDFMAGKVYAILGQNGSGKSTLLNCINNYISNYTGLVMVSDGEQTYNVKNIKNEKRAKIISHVNQSNIPNELSVYDTVMLGRQPYINISPNMTDHELVSRAIDKFNLNILSLKSTNELSGGEAQCVNIARAYAQNANIMLLDEPTNNLDIKKQHEIFNRINETVKSKNKTVIYVLHDINHAIKYADELLFLKDGKLMYSGSTDIVDIKLLKDIYGVEPNLFTKNKQKYIFI